MKKHVVQPGDCMESIAHANGFLLETLWEHPDNRELKVARKDPNALISGDEVVIPDKQSKWESVSTGCLQKFRVKDKVSLLRIELLEEGKVCANEKYKVLFDERELSGQTDDQGVLEIVVPPSVKRARLIVGEGKEEYELHIGSMIPVDNTEGIQMRLANLGYYAGETDGVWNEETEKAVMMRFRLEHGLGDSEEEFKEKLQALCAL
jgi:hypothetical protein